MFYNYRRIETTSAIETAQPPPPSPAVSKRDSPLDLSVKTIRGVPDSTAHDDAEAAAAATYSQHYPVAAHQPLRIGEARHPQMPQLPYATSGVRNTAVASFNGTSRPATHYYPETAYNSLANGQLAEDVQRMPVSEIRNEIVNVSITYEQKQQVHRTQVNAQISATQYSHQYYRLPESNAKLPQPPVNHMLAPPGETNHLSPAISAPATHPRKRRLTPTAEIAHPPKNPRASDWRESIEKEIENRLNAYTTKKAREREEERQLASNKNNDNSYQNNNSEGSAFMTREPPRTAFSPSVVAKLPKAQQQQSSSWQHPQKAQHKLPVQPVQMHPLTQQWYPPSQQRSYPYDNTQARPSFADAHSRPSELKIMQKIENAVQQKPLPLPSFQMGFAQKPPTSAEGANKVITETREKEKSEISAAKFALELKKEKDEEAQARAALMASALTHPRIRTKAELKQVGRNFVTRKFFTNVWRIHERCLFTAKSYILQANKL